MGYFDLKNGLSDFANFYIQKQYVTSLAVFR